MQQKKKKYKFKLSRTRFIKRVPVEFYEVKAFIFLSSIPITVFMNSNKSITGVFELKEIDRFLTESICAILGDKNTVILLKLESFKVES